MFRQLGIGGARSFLGFRRRATRARRGVARRARSVWLRARLRPSRACRAGVRAGVQRAVQGSGDGKRRHRRRAHRRQRGRQSRGRGARRAFATERALLPAWRDARSVDAATAPFAQDNWTPLHMAANKGHLDCVRRLLDAGADPSIATKARRAFATERAPPAARAARARRLRPSARHRQRRGARFCRRERVTPARLDRARAVWQKADRRLLRRRQQPERGRDRGVAPALRRHPRRDAARSSGAAPRASDRARLSRSRGRPRGVAASTLVTTLAPTLAPTL